MKRCALELAEGVFIMANKYAEDVNREDANNILRALAVKKCVPRHLICFALCRRAIALSLWLRRLPISLIACIFVALLSLSSLAAQL
jgi:hypothetical protein